MRAVPFSLSMAELEDAFAEGRRRCDTMRAKGVIHLDGTSEPNYDNDQEGAATELAVALFLGQPWTGRGGKGGSKGDVAGYYEVRWRRRHPPRLVIREHDKMDVPYILVTGRNGQYWIHGWEWGFVVREHGEYKPPDKGWRKNAWVMPDNRLRPMSILPPVGTIPEVTS